MGVVSVRIPDELILELELGNVKIGEVIKEDLLQISRRLQVDRRERTLAKFRSRPSRPVADLVRDLRREE
jgi:hypothetical protein